MLKQFLIVLSLLHSLNFLNNRTEMCNQMRESMIMMVNFIKDMDQEKQNLFWKFSLRKVRISFLENADFSAEENEKIGQIIEEIDYLNELHESETKEKIPKVVELVPNLAKRKLSIKIELERQLDVIKPLATNLKAKTDLMQQILASVRQKAPDFLKTVEYLKELKAINVELSMVEEAGEQGLTLINKMHSMIGETNRAIHQKVIDYARKLEDYNYFTNLLRVFDKRGLYFTVPKQPALDQKLQRMREIKAELGSTLDSLKDELLHLSVQEINRVTQTVTSNPEYIKFKSALRDAKGIKKNLIQAQKVYNSKYSIYSAIMTEYGMLAKMNWRISPMQAIKMSDRISHMKNILTMYPEEYNDQLVSDPSLKAKIQEVFAENKKLIRYQREYLGLAQSRQRHFKELMDQEKLLDLYFAKLWSTLMSSSEGRISF